MNRLRQMFGRLRLVKRLAGAEMKLATIDRAIAGLRFCQDCGGVLLLGHPATTITEVPGGKGEVRCKWDQAAYERSPLCRRRTNEAREARTH